MRLTETMRTFLNDVKKAADSDNDIIYIFYNTSPGKYLCCEKTDARAQLLYYGSCNEQQITRTTINRTTKKIEKKYAIKVNISMYNIYIYIYVQKRENKNKNFAIYILNS